VTLEYIEVPGGGRLYLIPEPRIEAARRRVLARISELQKTAENMERELANPTYKGDKDILKSAWLAKLSEAELLQADADAGLEQSKSLRRKYAKSIKKETYNYVPYSDGQKTDALSDATDWSSGEPKLDVGKYQRLLVAAACGFTLEEIRSKGPAEIEALIAEVIERSEPDPAKLDFLF
jgi:hypothetical protein